ncbi:hypothetical protein QYF36_025621 [Acer negundo]|nr:hypothetical protein QYF36_025621 [Acer negundo]
MQEMKKMKRGREDGCVVGCGGTHEIKSVEFQTETERDMKELFGSTGKVSDLMLRVGQCSLAAALGGFMLSAHNFYNSTVFCFWV